jgi:hypothetical protein
MVDKDANKEVLLMRAKRLQQYCDLLIEQCDNWIAVPNQNISKTKSKTKSKGKSFNYLKLTIDNFIRKLKTN